MKIYYLLSNNYFSLLYRHNFKKYITTQISNDLNIIYNIIIGYKLKRNKNNYCKKTNKYNFQKN